MIADFSGFISKNYEVHDEWFIVLLYRISLPALVARILTTSQTIMVGMCPSDPSNCHANTCLHHKLRPNWPRRSPDCAGLAANGAAFDTRLD